MRHWIEKPVSLGTELREGLARNQIAPFYEPKICLATRRIIRFEAMARSEHPTKGVLSSAYFRAAFDNTDLAPAVEEILENIQSSQIPPATFAARSTETSCWSEAPPTYRLSSSSFATVASASPSTISERPMLPLCLKHFPVYHVKIDKTFIKDLDQDSDDEAFVATIIALAGSNPLQSCCDFRV